MTEEVKTESVPIEGQVSPPAEKVEAEVPQPLTEERVQQLINEATQRAIEQGKDLGKREMQGIKDREVAQIKRQVDLEKRRASVYETGFSDLDEDTRSQIESRKLKSENEFYRTQREQEEAQRQQEIYFERLNQSLKDEVTSMGVDPADARIDFAQDAPDYFEGRKRFTASLAKIVKAERESLERTALDKAEERFKKLETEFRKEHGLDSQDTSTGEGVVSASDADFMASFGAGDLKVTKENIARYEEIKKKYY